MSYLIFSKLYTLIENDSNNLNNHEECEHNYLNYIKVKNYNELETILTEYGYEFTPGEILIDVKNKSYIEEALATPDSLILTIDNTEIAYSEIHFIIKKMCNNIPVININYDKKYCKECFEKINKQLSFDEIKNILESKNEMQGLSTSKKIEYILVKNRGKKLSASQIYNIGSPWNLTTLTPKNSVYARTSSLYKKGIIKGDGIFYYS